MATLFTLPTSRLPAAGFVLLALLSVLGCGSGQSVYPVQGQIVYADGSPATDLAGCTVTFEWVAPTAMAEQAGIGGWGEVQADGTFTIGTYKPADGAVAGKHRVAISPPEQEVDGPIVESPVASRYGSVETSGLEVEVARGTKKITLTVDRK
ncbi:MAG: hypothetical protein U1E05_10305 [Patescibacteria group bacterium]|nr:hypothetical protein [Patescibacteria group bacterium]